MGALTTIDGGTLTTSTGGVPTWLAAGSTSGVPLIAQGTSTPPVYGTAVVAGGGTGRATLTAGTVLSGNGTGNVLLSNTATAGQVFVGQTSSTSAQFITPTAGAGMTVTSNASTLSYAFTGGIQIVGQNSAPTAGNIGEQIRAVNSSGQSLSTGAITNITSILLTAGVWDISAVGLVSTTGASTGTNFGISTTGTTFPLVEVDAWNGLVQTTTALQFPFAIPSYRVTLASGATYYINMQCTFTTGTATGYGRISATRVA
jgi:hypothetical protein